MVEKQKRQKLKRFKLFSWSYENAYTIVIILNNKIHNSIVSFVFVKHVGAYVQYSIYINRKSLGMKRQRIILLSGKRFTLLALYADNLELKQLWLKIFKPRNLRNFVIAKHPSHSLLVNGTLVNGLFTGIVSFR